MDYYLLSTFLVALGLGTVFCWFYRDAFKLLLIGLPEGVSESRMERILFAVQYLTAIYCCVDFSCYRRSISRNSFTDLFSDILSAVTVSLSMLAVLALGRLIIYSAICHGQKKCSPN